jgi:hypothetical protein
MRRILWFVTIAALAGAACAGGPEPPPFKPVADLKQLMNAVIDPAADEIWDATGWIVTAAGEEERKPQNDEEWAAVRNHAIALTEAGNLLMMAPRARDGDAWMQRSQELIDTGTAAWRAADAKDVQKLFDTGGDVYQACVHCHESYMDAITNANK